MSALQDDEPQFRLVGICHGCKHRDPVDVTKCRAFPLGIPSQILSGRWDHRKPFPGDGGIQYEPRDKSG